MVCISLQNVSVALPIYNVHEQTFKKKFLRLTTGGLVAQGEHKHVVVNAIQNVTLTLQDGDRVGLIGHNGAGKSTFLRLLARIYEPSAGQMMLTGKVFPLLDMMQGIEVELTGYDNIMTRGILLGLTRAELKKKIQEIAEFSGLGDYLAMPLRTYSSGMMVRLAFAISTSINPEILLIDEVFGAGDAEFMQKARERMIALVNISNIVVIATHSDELIKEFCNKALLLEHGTVRFYGEIAEALRLYHRDKMQATQCETAVVE